MNGEIAFVGDIHGNIDALRGLWNQPEVSAANRVVFLGDYVNKGLESAEVLAQLIDYSADGRAELLRGNHEEALLEALQTRSLTAFLKMGGAATIRSYMQRPVGADVLTEFESNIPASHLEALTSMAERFETSELIAQHEPRAQTSKQFEISAHITVGSSPRIGLSSAEIDTGCGTKNGRLTAFFWPTRSFVQVDEAGERVTIK